MAPLTLPLCAFVAGILGSGFLAPRSVWLCLPLAVVVACARKPLACIPLFLAGAALRSHAETPPLPEMPTEAVRLEGTLTRAPEARGLGMYLDVRLSAVDGRPVPGRARLTEFLEEPEAQAMFEALDLGRGDHVEILVALRRPAVYRNPGAFDFRRYLEREGIYWTGTIRNPRLIQVRERGWHGPDRLRQWIEGRVARAFADDPEARGLVLGMTLGQKHELSARTEREFQAAGLYHLVVVSGFNLVVVATASGWLASLLARKRRTRLLVVAAATLAYAAIVGWQTPVVRAGIAAGILIAGKALDRGYSPLNALAASAFAILMVSPTALEDSSFQLTFSTVLAVIAFGVPAARWAFERLTLALASFDNSERDGRLPPDIADWRVSRRLWSEFHGVPFWITVLPWRGLRLAGEGLIVSVAVQLVLSYFMVESFHRMTPLSPLLNLPAGLIAAFVTPAGLSLAALPEAVARPGAWLIAGSIRTLFAITSWTLALPGASIRVPSAPPWLWVVYAAVLAWIVFSVHRRWKASVAGAFLALLLINGIAARVDFSPAPPAKTTLTFLDVGQGDSILAEFPDGRRILVDAGGIAAGRFLELRDESIFSIGEDVVSRYLFSRGIRRLDAVVLTHAHNDHMDGLFDVARNFQVNEAWLGRNPPIPRYLELLNLLSRRSVPIRWIHSGQTLGAGDIEVLHPPAAWRPRKTAQNNDSVVLLIRGSGGGTALLTGDIEIPLAAAPEHVQVFKVPHHGSRGAKLDVPADLKVISVGARNPFGHPDKSKLPAWRTDLLGAITVELR